MFANKSPQFALRFMKCSCFRCQTQKACVRLVVVQFGKEASQTRDYGVAKNAPPSRGSPRFFAAQRALAPTARRGRQNDNQTAPLPNSVHNCQRGNRGSGDAARLSAIIAKSEFVMFDSARNPVTCIPGCGFVNVRLLQTAQALQSQ